MNQKTIQQLLVSDEDGFVKLPFNNKEFDKRCHKVFVNDNKVTYYGIRYQEFILGNLIIIPADEEIKRDIISFRYCPNMSERPQALAYILGQRNDFND